MTPRGTYDLEVLLSKLDALILILISLPQPHYVRFHPHCSLTTFRVRFFEAVRRALIHHTVSRQRINTPIDLQLLYKWHHAHKITTFPEGEFPYVIRPEGDALPAYVGEIHFNGRDNTIISVTTSDIPLNGQPPNTPASLLHIPIFHQTQVCVYSEATFFAWLMLKEDNAFPFKIELTSSPRLHDLPNYDDYPSVLVFEDDDRPGTLILC